MLGLALALGASVSWGISDFLGGLQSRRFSALGVLLVSQPIGFVLAWAVVIPLGDHGLDAGQFALAALGGAAVLAALGAFYAAMALGSISVVSMIGALGVVVPIVGGIVMGEEPGALQAIGAAVALGGVLLVVREPDTDWRRANARIIGLAALAALGFGAFFLAIAGPADTDAAWTIAAARTGGFCTLLVAVAVLRPKLPRAGGATLVALVAIGCLDVLANSLYAVASTEGLLPVVAVGGSLYSVVTVILAGVVLRERLEPLRRAGVVIAVCGVGLIAAGA